MSDGPGRQVQRLFELSPDLLVVVDQDLRVIRANPAWERVLGLPPDEVVGHRLAEFMHPDDVQRTMREAGVLSSGGASVDFENRYLHVDGEVRWLQWASQVSREDGLIYAAARDVTGMRVAAEEARQALHRLEEAQRVARIGSFEFDQRTGSRFYTEQLYLLHGMDPERDEPLSPEEFVARVVPEDRDAVLRALARAASTGELVDSDFRMVHAPDRILHAHLQFELDADGVPILSRGTTQDVTQLRAEEAARRAGERRLAEAERLAGIGSFEWRATDGHVVWSEGMYRLYGVPPGARPISAREFYERMRPDEAAAAREALRRASETLGPYEIDFHMPDASGISRAMTARGEAYVERGALHVRGTVQDVTGQRRFAHQQQAIARLGQAALAGTDLQVLFADTCEELMATVGSDLADVTLLQDDGTLLIEARLADGGSAGEIEPGEDVVAIVAAVAAQAAPVVVKDWGREEHLTWPPLLAERGIRASAIVPIRSRDRAYGVLASHSRRPDGIPDDAVAFLEALSAFLATAIERHRHEAEMEALAALRGRLVAENLDAEERTRRRISEALHDGALQDLLAVRQDLVEAAGDQASGDREEMLAYARGGVERAVQQLREAVQALHPVVLQHGGLEAALRAAADHAARPGGFAPQVRVAPDAAGVRDELVLSLARELLTNAAKHAGATLVRAEVRRDGDMLVLEVADDGCGLDLAEVAAAPMKGHIGLASLAQRVDAVGGSVDLCAADGPGTTVRVVLPIG